MSKPTVTRFRVAAGAIVLFVGNDADGGGAQAQIFELSADTDIILRLACEERQFDAVITGGFDLCEQWKMLVGDLARPQKHVEAQKHFSPLFNAGC
jgi:hypothetical protein